MSKHQNRWPNAEAQQTIVPLFMGLFVSGCPVLVTPSPLKGQCKHACILRLKFLAAVTARAGLGFVLPFYVRCSDAIFFLVMIVSPITKHKTDPLGSRI